MKLSILGAGAVGSAVAESASAYGHDVVALADSTGAVVDDSGIDVDAALSRAASGSVGDADHEAALAAAYDVLVEATPTTLGDAEPGFSHVRTALERDRHVVLANKGPVAERYADLKALERDSEGTVRFEATVGGAMPVISTIEDHGPERIDAARGVLNGTANFVLSRMAAERLDYEHVLTEAQQLGVAETDPSFDVDGTDAALKCVILANLLSDGDETWSLDDADVEGIRNVSGSALELAAEDGLTVRLIGEVAGDSVRVAPRLVDEGSSLTVSGTTNVLQIETTRAGSITISGRGAGGPETASAVLRDVDRLE